MAQTWILTKPDGRYFNGIQQYNDNNRLSMMSDANATAKCGRYDQDAEFLVFRVPDLIEMHIPKNPDTYGPDRISNAGTIIYTDNNGATTEFPLYVKTSKRLDALQSGTAFSIYASVPDSFVDDMEDGPMKYNLQSMSFIANIKIQ